MSGRRSRFTEPVFPRNTSPTTRAPRRRIEAGFQSAVLDLIAYRHLWCFHIPDSRTAPAGWPDLTILGQGGALFRELKTAVGRLSPDQRKVIALLEASGQNVRVWRPSDLESGLIVSELDAIRRPRPQLQPEDVLWLIRELRGYDQTRPVGDQVWRHWRGLLEVVLNVDVGTLDTGTLDTTRLPGAST